MCACAQERQRVGGKEGEKEREGGREGNAIWQRVASLPCLYNMNKTETISYQGKDYFSFLHSNAPHISITTYSTHFFISPRLSFSLSLSLSLSSLSHAATYAHVGTEESRYS